MTDAPRKVSTLDLTVRQQQELVQEFGLPMSRWQELDSVLVMSRVYALVTGEDGNDLTLRDLVAAVSLGDDETPEDEGAETANPT